MAAAACSATAVAVLSGGPAAAAEQPATFQTAAILVSEDGSRLDLPVSTSILSDTVGGVTRWSIGSSVLVPSSAFGADPVDELLNVDPGDVVSADELAPPPPTSLLPSTSDPLAPVVGIEPPDWGVSDMDDQGGCETHSSGGVQACLRMYYTAHWSGSKYYVKLVSYHHRWRRLDPQFRMHDAFGRAGVNGRPASGGHLYDSTVKQFGTPVSDALYGHKPWWSGVDVDLTGNGYYQGANNEVTISRGTSRWTLLHTNVYRGYKPPF